MLKAVMMKDQWLFTFNFCFVLFCSLQLQTKSAENLPELENKIQQTIHRIIPIKELPQKLSSSFSTCVRIQTIKSSKPT